MSEQEKHKDTSSQDMADIVELPIDQLMSKLSSSEAGLTQDEAKHRLEQYGYNKLIEKKVHPIMKFLSYLWGPIPWMIEIAAILSGVVRDWSDFCIIMTLLVVNAIIGFWEEYQAFNAIAALKEHLALQARVKRDKKWAMISARELVPGDIVRLRIGDIVPADAKLVDYTLTLIGTVFGEHSSFSLMLII